MVEAIKEPTKKTEELLRDGGYLVDVTFHKVGTSITIGPKVLGVEVGASEELGAFFDQFIRNSQISWLGIKNQEIRKAESISKSVHKRKIKDSLDGKHYLPKSKLPEFKAFLKIKEKEFFKVRDNLVSTYEFYVRQFQYKLENDFLNETIVDTKEREQVIRAIMSKVPSKEEVFDSFKVEKSYMLFAMSNELMDDEDKEASLESAHMRMNGINGTTLSVVFDKVNLITNALTKKKYTKKHDRIFNEILQELDDRNIFLHSEIGCIKEEFQKIEDRKDISSYELPIGRVYRFAQEIHEEHQLQIENSDFTLKQLEFLAKNI